ncbi:hypothetical protein AVEN_10422-1 [Araneus ventricosus]|uniref:Uncharacterized protein n=1 Tax=Araneus ventricosus TaxID=182803 RepID=A0A4Y2NT87_ARAVE|nr:hypothetical protein AVEN_10422-1 [Araneus ventricosus]
MLTFQHLNQFPSPADTTDRRLSPGVHGLSKQMIHFGAHQAKNKNTGRQAGQSDSGGRKTTPSEKTLPLCVIAGGNHQATPICHDFHSMRGIRLHYATHQDPLRERQVPGFKSGTKNLCDNDCK